MRTLSLFEEERLSLPNAIALPIESLRHYGSLYKHWAIAFSGGKDSSATVTLVVHLIETGQIPRPESLTILYADTRQELPPLHAAAMGILKSLRDRGFDTRIVLPELDHRYFVYMLGRGVPPPSNTFRWCTPKLKVMSMEKELERLREERGEKFLMLTGVRIGESAARDQRIAMSCTKDGGECGQGWFQQSSSQAISDTLAPILHWRVCHVWDWLVQADVELGFPTFPVAQVYGMQQSDGEEPLAYRTGCIGCPLVDEDKALESILKQPEWAYLKPLKELRPIYLEAKKPQSRLRKTAHWNKDGTLSMRRGKLGPLSLEARKTILQKILKIQQQVNKAARAQCSPEVSLINDEELKRINELIDAKTYPEGWDGSETSGATLSPTLLSNQAVQIPLFTDKVGTIQKAIAEAMRLTGKAMTVKEIYQTIVDYKLFPFGAKDSQNVVRSYVRRHCDGLPPFRSASNKKYFVMLGKGYYWLKNSSLSNGVD